jgi:hypothetical protein
VNVFEGSRRVGYAIFAVGALLFATLILNKEPHINFKTYQVLDLSTLVSVSGCVGPSKYVDVKYDGASVNAVVCTESDHSIDPLILPPDEMKEVEERVNAQRWSDLKEAAMYLVLGTALWFAFMKAVGWIVRGFMGVPAGQDHRPARSAAPPVK